jgi:hypothetical protein
MPKAMVTAERRCAGVSSGSCTRKVPIPKSRTALTNITMEAPTEKTPNSAGVRRRDRTTMPTRPSR